MRPRATGSNNLSGSIICPSSVRPFVHGPFTILCLYSFPVWGSKVTIYLCPHWGQKDPSGVQSILYVRTSLCLLLHLSGCLHRFLVNICTTCICVQRMWPQVMGSTVNLYISNVSPYLGTKEPSEFQSSLYLCLKQNISASFSGSLPGRPHHFGKIFVFETMKARSVPTIKKPCC